jgi:hypothetical protein
VEAGARIGLLAIQEVEQIMAQIEARNEVVLVGRLAALVEQRELPTVTC